MLTVDVYNTKGEKVSRVTLPKVVFGVKPNQVLMAQAVRVYLANQRQATAKTKDRGEVAYSTRKLYRQKGTGRARHGARSAPIFVKGGVAHGPDGKQNYSLGMSKKMSQTALCSALTGKLKAKEIMVLTGLEKLLGKTKRMVKIIENLKFPPRRPAGLRREGKISLILPEVWEKVIRAGRNISYLNLLQVKQLNTYEVLNSDVLIFTKESIEVLKKRFNLSSRKEKKEN